MRKRISICIRKFLSCSVSGSNPPNLPNYVDYREEYANAFRTESYIEFWTRVLTLTHGDSATSIPIESTTAARLSSYRLFAEYLLDPDQPTVTQLLALAQSRPKNHSILAEYFSETANASFLCSLLLKDINRIRVWYRSLKSTLESHRATELLPVNRFPVILARVRVIQTGCSGLLKRLELGRDKARTKLQLVKSIKCGSAILLVALTASVAVIATTHALAMLVAAPGLIAASFELASTRKLARRFAQLDAAAKGTYILNKDMDMISRLVARLNNELEHISGMVRFWLEHKEDNLQASGEVARQLKENDSNFSQQLDELEEHLYLCFMTINRGRTLVVKEIMDQGPPTCSSK